VAVALLFLSPDDPVEAWRAELLARLPDLDFRVWPDEVGDPAEIDTALVWRAPQGELARYPNLKAILSLAAGIESLLEDPELPDVPVARMVDPGLTRGMAEYVLLAVLRHHREFDRYERAQRARRWDFALPRATAERRVGLLGLGELGTAAASTLVAHGFTVFGWSRTPKAIDGVTSYAGRDQLAAFLHRSEILVCLLPMTAETRGILDAELFALLPHGACVINVGRGDHLVERDLLAALDSGHLAGATLDVFREEPLPPESPLWAQEKVLITPHVASYSTPATAAPGVVENIRRARAGQPLRHQVDQVRGY
jgi:glyoxylate/hydroxypyruvate reductase